MHTIIMMSSGILLLLIFWGAGYFTEKTKGWLTAFIPVWFVITAVNMAVGIYEAGYTFLEELPIFLLLFGVPAIIAFIIKWRLSK
ncbi:hypothetical protein [Kangiella shandongensis]|uniref:hypothetical protein n=1 Tax=Kangiella shandongensis TaxID=2763258 RepID=UPI001CBEC795|nr:hypothetical protein [Kangiella shandongensis]